MKSTPFIRLGATAEVKISSQVPEFNRKQTSIRGKKVTKLRKVLPYALLPLTKQYIHFSTPSFIFLMTQMAAEMNWYCQSIDTASNRARILDYATGLRDV